MDKHTNKPERRAFVLDVCRIEQRSDNGPAKIIGHAAVFNSLSEDLGGFREMIKPGAFTRAVKEDDVRALFNHNPDHILGRNTAGTLTLAEDERGLLIEITPPDTQIARDLLVSMERGDITQMSFGFRTRAGGYSWGEDENGNYIRTLTDLKLYDVSPVTYPAYAETDVAVRSLTEHKQQHQQSHKNQLEFYSRRLRLRELSA